MEKNTGKLLKNYENVRNLNIFVIREHKKKVDDI